MATYIPYDESEEAQPSSSSKYVPYVEEEAPAPVKAQQGVDYRKELARQLGLTARMVPNAWGAATAISDPLVAGVNKLAGTNLPLPSQATQQLMDKYLPKPEGALEKGVQLFGGMAAGAMDPLLGAAQAITGKMAPAGFKTAAESQGIAQKETLKELHDAGYTLPPTEMGGGRTLRNVEGFGGSARVASLAEYKNQPVTQTLAAKALKLPPGTRLDVATLDDQAAALIREGYDPIRAIPQIRIGRSFRTDLQKIKTDLGGSNSFPLTKEGNNVIDLVNKYLYTGELDRVGNPRLVQAYTGEDAITHVKNLRTLSRAQFKPGGDPLLGEAMRRVATALEDNIETSLRGNNLVKTFREARTMLAKNFAVERMLADESSGMLSTVKAAQLKKAGVPLTDELNTIAKAGSVLYSRATGVPIHGLPPAINYGDAAMMGGGALLAPFTKGATSLIAGIPMARTAARYGVLSKPMQNMMARKLSTAPSIFGAPAARVAIGAADEFAPLFSQGEQ